MATVRKRKPKPGRPAKPLITRRTAAETAIAIVDEHGLAGLSLQAVARAMEVTAPSLYYHFQNKDDLLRLVAEALLREAGVIAEPASSWRETSIAISVAARRVIMQHPHAATLMLRFFPRMLMLGPYEKSLVTCPYPPEYQIAAMEALERLTFGSALFAAAAVVEHCANMPAFDTERYPLLARAVAASPFEGEALFIETLEALFDGFEARYGGKKNEGAKS